MPAAIVPTLAGWLGGGVFATAAAQLLASVAFSALAANLMRPSAPNVLRELQQTNALPAYRFVYGVGRAAGTPAPHRVEGAILYACYILNSRPSAGPFTVLFDKREVEYTGDPYDFGATGGATATNEPFDGYAKYWIGRGDQTSPPAQILTEVPHLFSATDGWRGRTVLWVRLDAGSSKSRADRWPAAPPEVLVDGNWSLVWDPRDPAQDADDPATWVWSNNAALCGLDALRQNPLASYDLRNLWLDTFVWAADVCDAGIPVKAGGTIPLAANGTIAFVEGTELEDQVAPILDAGGLSWVRARGQLGVIPPVAQDIALTVTDLLDSSPAQFMAGGSRDSLATHAAGKYVAPDRAYELTDLPAYEVPGALAADGGLQRVVQPQFDLVTDHRQGQFLQAIAARQKRLGRTLTASFPPAMLNAVAGSWVTLDLPSPWTRRSGTYQVESIQPVFTDDAVGVVCRIEATLREISPSLYDWTPATDEQDVEFYEHDASVSAVAPPGAILTFSGADVAIQRGGVTVPRVRFEFAPSTSASVYAYEWQWRPAGGDWTDGPQIDAEVRNADDQVFGYFEGGGDTGTYELRVWALAPGKKSAVVTETGIIVTTGIPRLVSDWEDAIYQIDRATVPQTTVFWLTRAGPGTYIDPAGLIQTAAADVARIDHSGGSPALLIEDEATNLVVGSGAPAAQSVSVTAQSYALSFYGTGSVDLTGAHVATVTGSGATVRTTYVFTPTAGALVVTPAGTVTQAQIEAGTAATSYIQTTTAPVTRAADVPQLGGITAPLDLTVTYGDGTTASLSDQSVYPGYWPSGLSQSRIRRIVGTP